MFLCAFDQPDLDREDWRPRPLKERKAMVGKILAAAPLRSAMKSRRFTIR
jgi:ATP-dependent DNA ligase